MITNGISLLDIQTNLYCQFVYGIRMGHLQAIPSVPKEGTMRFTHHKNLTCVKATQQINYH
jgi:hypothetical protein